MSNSIGINHVETKNLGRGKKKYLGVLFLSVRGENQI